MLNDSVRDRAYRQLLRIRQRAESGEYPSVFAEVGYGFVRSPAFIAYSKGSFRSLM